MYFIFGHFACSIKMKAFLLFTVLIFPSVLALSTDDEENFIEVEIEPDRKYYDSDGHESFFGPSKNEQNRFIRSGFDQELTACKYPSETSNSHLHCRIYPSRIYCNQTCMYGHTLSNGVVQRETMCIIEEDEWTPPFEICKPFVDCTLRLGPGGKYKCYTHFMDRLPKCKISCAHYEDIPAVPEAMYECDIRGKWTPKLPYCATAGTGIKLSVPPKGVII